MSTVSIKLEEERKKQKGMEEELGSEHGRGLS